MLLSVTFSSIWLFVCFFYTSTMKMPQLRLEKYRIQIVNIYNDEKNKRAGATFDLTLFDNSNQRKVVRQPSKLVMFDSDLVQRGSSNCRTLN